MRNIDKPQCYDHVSFTIGMVFMNVSLLATSSQLMNILRGQHCLLQTFDSSTTCTIPICCMYGIFINVYPKNNPVMQVNKYTTWNIWAKSDSLCWFIGSTIPIHSARFKWSLLALWRRLGTPVRMGESERCQPLLSLRKVRRLGGKNDRHFFLGKLMINHGLCW